MKILIFGTEIMVLVEMHLLLETVVIKVILVDGVILGIIKIVVVIDLDGIVKMLEPKIGHLVSEMNNLKKEDIKIEMMKQIKLAKTKDI